ncbi:MAG TPA: hypothetical protein VHC86_01180 [Opitutaceae bacterium]|nr:hypothetical protein [Opitutaceae bacterium]
MKLGPPVVLAALGALLAGCEGPVAMPASTAVSIPASVALGRPRGLSSASHMGYWIYQDEDLVWHLRATTQGVRHRFEGAIHPLPGTTIANLRAVGSKRKDELEVVNGDIRFDFHPHEDVDGIDFNLLGPPQAEFALRIDGDYDPTHIRIGRRQKEPASAHFLLTP